MNNHTGSDTRRVQTDWIDYNGHMNLAYYVLAFDQDVDLFLDRELGVGPSLASAHNQGPFVLQNHVHYLDELLLTDRFYCRFLLLGADSKRLHLAGVMHRESDDAPVCVMEQVLINVDHETRRSKPYPDDIQIRIAALVQSHESLERPPQIGRPIGLTRR